ncbi:MAG TPA: SDR family NAD(P)-dependent oxidoreductase, partial [Polyangiaceae bacterium]|nr:SDR family NAD(P)-dependent oxidoreductase [Polyangiaceae bacterium]
WIDRGLELLRGEGEDLSPLFLPSSTTSPELAERFERPSSQLPAIFLVEYALARLWMNWGIEPKALIGHSMGENTAACVAGVFRFEDALRLVHLRGRLMDEVPEGGMLSVALSAKELEPLLGDDLDLASANAPELSVASGPREALEALGRTLAERGVEAKWVRIRIAAHSRMLEPVLGRYGDFLRGLALAPPKIPVVSNVSGTFLTASEATCPDYWTRHLRSRVRFAEGIATLAQDPGRAFLEVGPGRTLSSLARQHPDVTSERLVLASLGHPDESIDDAAFVLTVFGRLWAAGLPVDLAHARGPEARRLARLPTYPFQHQRYFIEPGKVTAQTAGDGVPLRKVAAIDDWFYRPVWRPAEPLSGEPGRRTWLVFIDDAGLGAQLTHALRERGDEVVVVHPSDAYYQLNHNEYRLSPEHGRDGYDALVRDLVASGKVPDRVVHLWLVAANEKHRPGSNFFHRNQERGFYSLLFLAQALADQGTGQSTHLTVVSSGMQQVGEEGVPFPDQATVLGPCKVIPHEIPRTTCASVDIVLPQVRRLRLFETKGRAAVQAIASQLMLELSAPPGNRVVALREGNRFEQTYEPMSSHEAPLRPVHVRAGGTYVVTGGLGGIGLTLARHLASLAKVNLVLVARKGKDGPDRGAAVRELESLGAEVLVVASDVTDPERMKDGLAEARRRFGKLHGVIHAAGMLSDELLQAKTQAQIENVFAPKVYGTLVLDALLSADDLDFFFLFSSTSVASGPVGQIDYVAANAFLNAYAEGRGQRLSRRTTAIGWGIWNGVGMAAESVKTLGERPARQSAAERPVSHPLFHSRTTEGGDERFWGRLSPATDWVLDEHRTSDGRAVVPGTAYLEMIAATLAEVGVSTPFEVQDLLFMRPMAVADDRIVELWATLRKSEQGYDFEVHSKVEAVRGDGSELHAQAKIVLGVGSRPAPEDLDALADRCSDRAHHDPNGILSGQEKHMRFGPRWRVLREAKYGRAEAFGRLELPPKFTGDLAGYRIHPALFDIATGFAMDLIDGYVGDALWVPVSYGKVRVFGPLPARIASQVRIRPVGSSPGVRRESLADFASFDVTLTDEGGNVLVLVTSLTLRKLAGTADFGGAKPLVASPAPTDRNDVSLPKTLSPAELAFVTLLQQGISPKEGCAAFDRVLAKVSSPVILVTSVAL